MCYLRWTLWKQKEHLNKMLMISHSHESVAWYDVLCMSVISCKDSRLVPVVKTNVKTNSNIPP